MVARTIKSRPTLPQANSLCYKVDATSVNLFSDFTINLRILHFFSKLCTLFACEMRLYLTEPVMSNSEKNCRFKINLMNRTLAFL